MVNLSDHVVTLLQEFQVALQLPPKPVRAIKPTWKPPNHDKLKTNFDGAMFEDLHGAGIGVRNSVKLSRGSNGGLGREDPHAIFNSFIGDFDS